MSICMTAPAFNTTIESYPLTHVSRRLVDKNILSTEVVEEAITEYRKYMTLLSLGFSPLDMFSTLVDEVWHAHILFTRDYANFCQQAFGYFVHHNPYEGTRSQSGATSHFITAYMTVFMTEPPAIWNGLPAHSDCGDGC